MFVLDRADYYCNDLFRFSTTEKQWEQLNATRVSGSPPGNFYPRMVSVGNDLYVIGSSTLFTCSIVIFRFLTTERKWEHLDASRVSGSPPSPRDFFGVVSVGSDLYVFGGYGVACLEGTRYTKTGEQV